ncbi:TPA: hypothetical protein SBQ34_003463 [Raoultella ornithinolytica]|uniref:Uncharacterized protein n=1 Tax=Raoultella ornithinolytica TaxID=54291 RepID=A0ABZ2E3F2_RAOOR|nr:hypothetical protein [Raoultella ornithinolytica]EKU2861391.1 hypothetical protein [Raoultella ornithinolytica]EKU2865444.1 hypothetical protein [Raoultella ornithinolytica]ELS0898158.1 hypothetical protein [Raoultella ornithinolytica]HAT2281821.1 hypothetical protein [Raoultella ornithinolytica]HAT2345854.1 hypothetical protein [Raoultella ornithinolytica]
MIIALKMKAFCNKELNLNLDNNPLVIAPFLSAQRAGWPPLFSSILCWVRTKTRESRRTTTLKNSVFILLAARLMRNWRNKAKFR